MSMPPGNVWTPSLSFNFSVNCSVLDEVLNPKHLTWVKLYKHRNSHWNHANKSEGRSFIPGIHNSSSNRHPYKVCGNCSQSIQRVGKHFFQKNLLRLGTLRACDAGISTWCKFHSRQVWPERQGSLSSQIRIQNLPGRDRLSFLLAPSGRG